LYTKTTRVLSELLTIAVFAVNSSVERASLAPLGLVTNSALSHPSSNARLQDDVVSVTNCVMSF